MKISTKLVNEIIKLIDKHFNVNNKCMDIFKNEIGVGYIFTSNLAMVITAINNMKLFLGN